MASQKLKQFFAVLFSLIILDFTVISIFVLPLYKSTLTTLIRTQNNIISAVITWIIISIGIIYFVSPYTKSAKDSFIRGAIFGGIVYGVFDLTNYTVFANWTIQLVAIDIIWGIILCGLVSVVSNHLKKE